MVSKLRLSPHYKEVERIVIDNHSTRTEKYGSYLIAPNVTSAARAVYAKVFNLLHGPGVADIPLDHACTCEIVSVLGMLVSWPKWKAYVTFISEPSPCLTEYFTLQG